jgi:hypothetical protein
MTIMDGIYISMSTDFDEEFNLVKALRDSQALEMVEETDNGWQTKVVADSLAQKAADRICELEQQVTDLIKQVNDLRNQKQVD